MQLDNHLKEYLYNLPEVYQDFSSQLDKIEILINKTDYLSEHWNQWDLPYLLNFKAKLFKWHLENDHLIKAIDDIAIIIRKQAKIESNQNKNDLSLDYDFLQSDEDRNQVLDFLSEAFPNEKNFSVSFIKTLYELKLYQEESIKALFQMLKKDDFQKLLEKAHPYIREFPEERYLILYFIYSSQLQKKPIEDILSIYTQILAIAKPDNHPAERPGLTLMFFVDDLYLNHRDTLCKFISYLGAIPQDQAISILGPVISFHRLMDKQQMPNVFSKILLMMPNIETEEFPRFFQRIGMEPDEIRWLEAWGPMIAELKTDPYARIIFKTVLRYETSRAIIWDPSVLPWPYFKETAKTFFRVDAPEGVINTIILLMLMFPDQLEIVRKAALLFAKDDSESINGAPFIRQLFHIEETDRTQVLQDLFSFQFDTTEDLDNFTIALSKLELEKRRYLLDHERDFLNALPSHKARGYLLTFLAHCDRLKTPETYEEIIAMIKKLLHQAGEHTEKILWEIHQIDKEPILTLKTVLSFPEKAKCHSEDINISAQILLRCGSWRYNPVSELINSVEKFLPGLTPHQVLGLFDIIKEFVSLRNNRIPLAAALVKRYKDPQQISFLVFFLSLMISFDDISKVEILEQLVSKENIKDIDFEEFILSKFKKIMIDDEHLKNVQHNSLLEQLKSGLKSEKLANFILSYQDSFLIDEQHPLTILAKNIKDSFDVR
jgi:hypothetical protein